MLALSRNTRALQGVDDDTAESIRAVASLVADNHKAFFDDPLSCIVCPLVWRQALLGLMIVFASHQSAFATDDVLSMADLAEYATPAMARDHQFAFELDLLSRTSQLDPEIPLESNQPLKGLLTLLCERIRIHRGANWVVIVPYDAARGTVRRSETVASYREPPAGELFEAADDDRSLSEAIESGEVEYHRAIDGHTQGWLEVFWSEGIQSVFAITLKTAKRLPGGVTVATPVGLLVLAYERAKGTSAGAVPGKGPRFSEAEKKWIRFYARIAQEYLQQHDRIAHHSLVDRAVLGLYERLDPKKKTEDTLAEIFKLGVELVGATAGVLAVPCGSHQDLVIVAEQGLNAEVRTRHIPFGAGVTGYCGKTRMPVLIPESQDPRTWPPGVERLPWVADSRTEMAVPLLSDGELIGVLDVESQTRTAAFGVGDQEALTHLALAGTIAVNLTHTLEQLETLRDVGQQLSSVKHDDEVFEIVLRAVLGTTHAHSASARILDPTQLLLESILHLGEPGKFGRRPIPVTEGVIGTAYQTGRACFVADVLDKSTWPPGVRYIPSRPDTRCEFAVPIALRGDRIGVLNFEHVQPNGLKRYQQFIGAIASQATHVLYQRRQQKRELRARDVDVVEGLSEFVSYVAHSLDIPIARIKRALHSESEGIAASAPETIASALASIEESVQDFLRYVPSKFAAVGGVPVVKLLRSTVDRYVSQNSRLRDVFRLDIGCSIDTAVIADEKFLGWCFERIIDNSLAYCGGAPQIEVRATASVQHVEVTFADNGPGVPVLLLPTLYEANRGHSTTRGRGRALSTCRTYIGAMQGTIVSRNRDPHGLVTTVVLLIGR